LRAGAGAGTTQSSFVQLLVLMTNRGAVIFALLIIGAIALDVVIFGSDHLVFLGKKFADMLEWMAFWR